MFYVYSPICFIYVIAGPASSLNLPCQLLNNINLRVGVMSIAICLFRIWQVFITFEA